MEDSDAQYLNANNKTMNTTKKLITIITAGAIVLIIAAVLFILLNKKDKTTYPTEPIIQESLSTTTTEKINLNNINDMADGDYPVWRVSQTTKLTNVKELASTLGLKMTSSVDGQYYSWGEEGSSIFYDLTKNSVVIEMDEGIPWSEVTIKNTTFSRFIKKYFNEDWNYSLFKTGQNNDGTTTYYAKRYINNEYIIETENQLQETDYIIMNGEKMVAAKFLLTIFTEENITVPLISSAELKSYINLETYPKDIIVKYDSVENTVLSKVNYLTEDFTTIIDTLDSCTASSSELVYFYKTFSQELLTPVFKLNLDCTITYNNEPYYVTAIAYVNAVDPDYVSN